MRFTAPLTAFALLSLLAACGESASSPAAAPDAPRRIVNGEPTGAAHGSVGALLYDYDGNGKLDGWDQVCTGTLVSPTVFLTAAHCVNWVPADTRFYVTFDSELFPAPRNVIAAKEFHYDPAYGHDEGDPHDVAVVILSERSTRGITPLRLPPAGHLDALAARNGLNGRSFVNVGYGVSASRTGWPSFPYDGLRRVSTSQFSSLQDPWLNLLMNTSATGEGGDCYGDSGGPKFLEGHEDVVLAVVSTGDYPCRATSRSYRVDTPVARAFL
ncbi:MAG TPA: trypsin-like serine protease, partial [Longimicrobiaceae bacterium]|nr:trypsin-like serine protease [Longimicrobiaceae bacterium]